MKTRITTVHELIKQANQGRYFPIGFTYVYIISGHNYHRSDEGSQHSEMDLSSTYLPYLRAYDRYVVIFMNSDSSGQVSGKCIVCVEKKSTQHIKKQGTFIKDRSVLALFVALPVHIINYIL